MTKFSIFLIFKIFSMHPCIYHLLFVTHTLFQTYMLDQVPGSEEAVFQDLLSLSSEQGLLLPLRATVVDPIASTMSLNAVSDNSEMHIAQAWDQIALRLRLVPIFSLLSIIQL